jgi:hypothetical protein
MSIIISGTKTVCLDYSGYITLSIEGVEKALEVRGDPYVSVPFTKLVNLVKLFRDNMDFYDKFCSQLKGLKTSEERLSVSHEFLKTNILNYIDDNENMEVTDIDFMNMEISSVDCFRNTLMHVFGSLEEAKKVWKDLQAAKFLEKEEEKKQKKRDNDEYWKGIILNRKLLKKPCRFGYQCRFRTYGERPCRFLHPEDNQ